MAAIMVLPEASFDIDVSSLLESIECPAILLTGDYQIVAENALYRNAYGKVSRGDYCYRVSHGYDQPCDQAGESCPLLACKVSQDRERVLHIHNSSRGREHIDVEMLPIKDRKGESRYFIEILKPVYIASAEVHSERMVGQSSAFNQMLEMINLVASRNTSVLLLGESGTGKELAATAIHESSARSSKNIVTVECSGLSETLFESELFGHVKGAFTGASSNKPGLLDEAQGGTLFLDEIGDVPLGMQVKLLRLLEAGCYRAVGSNQLKRADFRLISATNKDLPKMIRTGEFREDLYYRINAFPINLPPLRDRREDIPLIARSLLKKFAAEEKYHLTESAVKRLQSQYFPGNIRELRNALERAIIFSKSNVIDAQVFDRCLEKPSTQHSASSGQNTWLDLKAQEKNYLSRLLDYCDGDKDKAARIADISVRSLYRKLESAVDMPQDMS